jgi:lipoyl(octanoyl) transferase
MRRLEIRRLGCVDYRDALALQRELVRARAGGELVHDVLLLVTHPHVLTLGVRGDGGRSHILAGPGTLAARQVAVYEAGRGGDVTYHGPGQIVGYPIIDLKPDRCDVHRYVRDLEEAIIRAMADFDIPTARVPGLTGVWTTAVPQAKLAAIGVRIARWVTSHGFALNVAPDLSFFDLIVPCGIADKRVTSMRELGCSAPQREVENRVIARLAEVLGREPVELAAVSPTPDRLISFET